MANLNKIKDNLNKIDYKVKLSKEDKVVSLILPGQKNKFAYITPKTISYIFKRNSIIKTLNGKKDSIKAPYYSLKLLATLDIMLECNRLNYPTELIQFGNDTIEQEDTDPLLKIFLLIGDNKCSKKEQDLISIVHFGISYGFSLDTDSASEKSNITEGYQLIKQMFLEGMYNASE